MGMLSEGYNMGFGMGTAGAQGTLAGMEMQRLQQEAGLKSLQNKILMRDFETQEKVRNIWPTISPTKEETTKEVQYGPTPDAVETPAGLASIRNVTKTVPRSSMDMEEEFGLKALQAGDVKTGTTVLTNVRQQRQADQQASHLKAYVDGNTLLNAHRFLDSGDVNAANDVLKMGGLADKIKLSTGTPANTGEGIIATPVYMVQNGVKKLIGNTIPGKGGAQHFQTVSETEGKNQTEEQLTRTALFDPDPVKKKEAQGVLDAMQNRKVQTAAAGRAIIDAGKSKEIDIPSMARAVAEGNDARMAIRGSMGNPVASKVQTEVLKEYPNFNFMMSDANYKWKQSSTNQRTINFAGGALPRLERLDAQLTQMPNVDLNTINRVMRAVSVETGKPEFTNFESNRNAIVQEINTALSGSSTTSDMRVKIELENLQAARSPKQITGAISNLREALIARLDVDLSPIYPTEVVQGKKSMEQYKQELFSKYRGKYGAEGTPKTDATGGIKTADDLLKKWGQK
jgi:hypothetical protein